MKNINDIDDTRNVNERQYRRIVNEYDGDQDMVNPWGWVIPLLLFPLFFFIGWLSSDYIRGQQSSNTGQQFGVGGGPFVENPTIIPTFLIPTMMPIETITQNPIDSRDQVR